MNVAEWYQFSPSSSERRELAVVYIELSELVEGASSLAVGLTAATPTATQAIR